MIYKPQNITKGEGFFTIDPKMQFTANNAFDNDSVKEFWHNFCFNRSNMEISCTDELVFKTAGTSVPELDGYAYAIRVTKDGISVVGEDTQSLLHGFITLIDRVIAVDEKTIKIDCCEIRERALIANRMIHYCVFPDTELYELDRFVRLCAALKYTHVIVEFWGMIKYDCMKELSWEHAYTKEQIRPIIQTAKELGVEVIPMFNHWGHASAGRIMHGKHVVLDRAPELQHYFSEDGWCWDIKKPFVRDLLRQIRNELIELFGDGEYFHLGLDESFTFEFTDENIDAICDFINEIAGELASKGKKAIIWGDMFVYKDPSFNPKNIYTANCPNEKIQQYILSRLNKDIIIADWQYDCPFAPVESAAVFKKAGFKTMLCPWDRGAAKTDACMSTIKAENLFGVMHTTWDKLSWGSPFVTRVALECWDPNAANRDYIFDVAQTAEIMRKAYHVHGNYSKAGWAKYEVGVHV